MCIASVGTRLRRTFGQRVLAWRLASIRQTKSTSSVATYATCSLPTPNKCFRAVIRLLTRVIWRIFGVSTQPTRILPGLLVRRRLEVQGSLALWGLRYEHRAHLRNNSAANVRALVIILLLVNIPLEFSTPKTIVAVVAFRFCSQLLRSLDFWWRVCSGRQLSQRPLAIYSRLWVGLLGIPVCVWVTNSCRRVGLKQPTQLELISRWARRCAVFLAVADASV